MKGATEGEKHPWRSEDQKTDRLPTARKKENTSIWHHKGGGGGEGFWEALGLFDLNIVGGMAISSRRPQ